MLKIAYIFALVVLKAAIFPEGAVTDLNSSKWLSGPLFGRAGIFDTVFIKKNGINRPLSESDKPEIITLQPLEKFYLTGTAKVDITALDRSLDAINATVAHSLGIKGKGVAIGIYDTGIDWTHADFTNSDGTTRIAALWDQSINPKGTEKSPSYNNCGFGVEYTSDDINRELRGETNGNVRSRDYSGHGTHVAAIAASNGLARNERSPTTGYSGVAPEASLIIIKGSYGDGAVSAGLEYMVKKAADLAVPLSVNFSFGGHTGAHDGTSETEKKIDSLFNATISGRFITVAAGNDNLDSIHLYKYFQRGEDKWEIPFSIAPYTPVTGQYNDAVAFSFWHSGGRNNRITVSLLGPDSNGNPTREFGPFQYSLMAPAKGQLIDSLGYVEVYNATNTANGKDQIIVYLVDSIVNERPIQPVEGNWKIVLTRSGTSSTGEIHGWYLTHPEGFDHTSIHASIPSADNTHSVVVPATSKEALTTGGFISKNHWVASTGDTVNYYMADWPYYPGIDTLPVVGSLYPESNAGPTVDGRMKPEIVAPAQAITASRSINLSYNVAGLNSWDTIHLINSGTSMAAPHVAGVAALFLSINPSLNQQSLKSLLMQSAKRDNYTGDSASSAYWGAGKLWIDSEMFSNASNNRVHIEKQQPIFISPNPFSRSINIHFNAPSRGVWKLKIFSINGQLISASSHGVEKIGHNKIRWVNSDRYIHENILFITLSNETHRFCSKIIQLK